MSTSGIASVGIGLCLTAAAVAGGHGRRGFPPNVSGYGPADFFGRTMSAELYTTPLVPDLRTLKKPTAPKPATTAVPAPYPPVSAPFAAPPAAVPPVPLIPPPVPMPDPKLPIPFEGEKPMVAPETPRK